MWGLCLCAATCLAAQHTHHVPVSQRTPVMDSVTCVSDSRSFLDQTSLIPTGAKTASRRSERNQPPFLTIPTIVMPLLLIPCLTTGAQPQAIEKAYAP